MNITYRPEIDGLRTLAVFLVILHHLDFALFKGGFVGVDVFFVISGFLITSILAKDISNNLFSLAEFYKRRVIRLAPAYFVVIFATSIYAFYIMLPVERVEYSWSGLSSLVFSANFYMWKAVGGYFGSGSETTPLLHLWSLAVEEQFYLFWPLAFFITAKVFSRWSVVATAAFVLIALALSEWAVHRFSTSFTYYVLPTRAFELLIGALLALLPLARLQSLFSSFVKQTLCLLGAALILYSSYSFGEDVSFPGFSALLPCLGTAMLIAFMQPNKQIVGQFFANPLMVSIGKVSYPAYLWHWPIIAFINFQLIEIDYVISLFVITLTLLLSYLTYYYVELPAGNFRKSKSGKVVLIGFVLPASIFAALFFSVILLNGEIFRSNQELSSRAYAINQAAHEVRPGCHTGEPGAPLAPEHCSLGIDKQEVDFLLVGDSHANHFTGMLDIMALDAGVRGYEVTMSATAYLPDVKRYYYKQGKLVEHGGFEVRNKYITERLLPSKYKYVVLGASVQGVYSSYLMFADNQSEVAKAGGSDPKVFERGIARAIDEIIKNGSIPVVIADSPSQDRDVSSCALNNLRFNRDIDCRMPRSEYEDKFGEWLKFLAELEVLYPSLIVIDPAKVMCDEQYCYSELNGTPLYRDKGHLNYLGSELIGELYIERFGNPFNPKKAESRHAMPNH